MSSTIAATGFAGVRLNRRGRLVMSVLAALVLIGAVLALSATFSVVSGMLFHAEAQANSSTAEVVEYVTVQDGQTLWGIASEAAPNSDPRDTITKIVELNQLDGTVVRTGQRLAIPEYQ
ncbi:LysM peptidoglycan-binding domain-containing protein [Saxibacter everestensis]|uniref:LysM peptidoglycan-binding domain-containing protein n=1 Tax=Saxibacter everestensis TaxID=2909229 RepID=A0ABY8QVS6_9MICO|nr:LysM peptidoglycan-binding domain-containing protein [Brevibacteriaceae bacterium ZFBP1038]